MLLIHKKCQNIDHDEDTKEFEDNFTFARFERTEVEPSPTGRYSSQLLVELYFEKVRQLVITFLILPAVRFF